VVTDQQRFAGFSLDTLWRFLTVTFHSFWAQFGWMAIPAPDRLYWIWGGLTLLAIAGLMRIRDQLKREAYLILLASVAIALVAHVAYNLAFEQFQGRYLFPALVPIAILLVSGWAKPAISITAALSLIALNAYTLARVLLPGFG
jgi:hypothetical protein